MHHVIIGNGPAGVAAAETLRQADPRSYITVISAEELAPYSRTAIPYFIAGKAPEEDSHLSKRESYYERLDIELLRAKVRQVVPAEKTLLLQDGSRLIYDRLLLAAGASPAMRIPGADLPNVYSCWTLDDARRICDKIKPDTRVLLMGAGFVGCIIVSPLLARGAQVSIVASSDRMVPRMVTSGAGKLIQKWVEHSGAKVYNDARVTALKAEPDGSVVASFNTGENIAADIVINATGGKANIGFLKDSGIATESGVLVDEHLRTNQPDIYAAGDIAQVCDKASSGNTIHAIQPNAMDQGRIAGLNMAGRSVIFNNGTAMNVLDVGGLISSSLGRWWGTDGGEHVELIDENGWKYMRLEFKGDVMVGATTVGFTRHVGVLRGLIQSQLRLGKWKDHLLKEPLRVMDAYIVTRIMSSHLQH